MGANFEALDEGVLMMPLDPRYTQVGFNLIFVEVRHFFHQTSTTIPFLSAISKFTKCFIDKKVAILN